MSNKNSIVKDYDSLAEFLKNKKTSLLKKHHCDRTCYETYLAVKKVLAPINSDISTGAMASEVQTFLKDIKACLENINVDDAIEYQQKINDFLSKDPTIFLNNHGEEHIEKVEEKAYEIAVRLQGDGLTEIEVFILLCAIQIHDIGNILGRVGHEKNLGKIFEEKCKEIIPDSIERNFIERISSAHGGTLSNGSKDTISSLEPDSFLQGYKIRTRLLAAILRLADELADDNTRASRGALDLGIIGTNSKIYQDYSAALHTVLLEKGDAEYEYKIILVYNLDYKNITEKYSFGGNDKFLLDEIYDRTIKMERERRYCMKFMSTYINVYKIEVKIEILGDTCVVDKITYTLEDTLYPQEPTSGSIKKIENTIRTGKEELAYLGGMTNE